MRCVVATLTCVLLALSPPGEGCRSTEYEAAAGLCCPLCDKGSVVLRNCTHELSTNCRPCQRGTYMDEDNGRSQCMSCRVCDPERGLGVERECTRVRDAACAVLDGFYCLESNQEAGCTRAQTHSRCLPGQMAVEPGTRTTDTVCEDCQNGFYAPNGTNCTAWNICVDGEVELRKGSPTEDVLCTKAPYRHHYVVILPVLLSGAVVGWLVHAVHLEDFFHMDRLLFQHIFKAAHPVW